MFADERAERAARHRGQREATGHPGDGGGLPVTRREGDGQQDGDRDEGAVGEGPSMRAAISGGNEGVGAARELAAAKNASSPRASRRAGTRAVARVANGPATAAAIA
ncbi:MULTISPECIES: hypothetical protein [Streptomycetaceae]|uniref:hypothetical protein n=1 Tax=Streptomycetaceae TaxID=2062 RepID=UPI001E5CBE53|nr:MULTISPECIES: hypothetical protein [Streptomycetaceae]